MAIDYAWYKKYKASVLAEADAKELLDQVTRERDDYKRLLAQSTRQRRESNWMHQV